MSISEKISCSKLEKEKNQHIKVFVRVRPSQNSEKSKNILEYSGTTELTIKERPFDKNAKKFTFDKVFGSTSQQVDIYHSVVGPLVSEVLAGYNCTVFAYGQTGTGKTFTMEGKRSNDPSLSWHDDPMCGIIPRALSHLFDELRIIQVEYSVKVSFLELYNEELLDLLSPVDDSSKLKLFEDATKKGSVIVHGLEEVTVRSKNEVYEILEKGSLKRQTAATMLNAHSSRSHTVFSITVHIKENSLEGDELIKQGKLNLVDLAGSENIGRSGAVDKRAREAGNINQSLLTLGRVITSLVERAPHVPYRESKLTRLLQESLGGRTKTSIIATVSPNQCNIEETLSTLEYAHRAKNIQNKPELNQKLAKKALIKEYTEEIDRLRRDLIATRERNGIFVAKENYNEMLSEIELRKEEMAVLLNSSKNLKECLEEKEKSNAALSLSLSEYKEKLLEATEELQETKGQLAETLCERDEKVHIIEHHVKKEQQLLEQANCLLTVADNSTTDLGNLYDSIEKRRILEKENASKCNSFHDVAEMMLQKLHRDINTLHQEEKFFSFSLKQKLVDKFEEMRAWSSDAEKRISSLIGTQIQMQQKLDQDIGELQSSVELINHTQDIAEKKQKLCKKELQETSKLCQEGIHDLQQKLSILQNANEDMINDLNTMLHAHNVALEMQISSTNRSLLELHDDMVQKLTDMKGNMEVTKNIINDCQASKSSFTEEVLRYADKISSRISLFNSQTDAHFVALMERNSSNSNLSENVLKSLKKLQQHSTSIEILQDSQLHTKNMEDSLNEYTKKTSAVQGEMENNASGVLQHAMHVMSSGCQNWEDHIHNLSDGLTKIKTNLQNVQANHHEGIKDFTERLQSSLQIHAQMRKQPVSLVEMLTENCARDVKIHSEEIGQLCQTTTANIENLNEHLNELILENLESYVASGETPERKEYIYPKDLVSTSPHNRILERYRANRLEVEVPDISESFEPSDGGSLLSLSNSRSRINMSSSTTGVTPSKIGRCISSSHSVLVEDKENDADKAGISGYVKETVQRRPRKILSSQN